ncbi:unnamed protein product, partial [Symbiodinium pilosum]
EAVSAHAEWPAKELQQARALVASMDSWEEAMQKGRSQITAQEGGNIGALCEALE